MKCKNDMDTYTGSNHEFWKTIKNGLSQNYGFCLNNQGSPGTNSKAEAGQAKLGEEIKFSRGKEA